MNTEDKTVYSLVIPVYKNAASIDELVSALESMNQTLGGRLEVVFIVDGSPDDSYALLQRALHEAGFNSQLVALSRNFGAWTAVWQGLHLAAGPYFATMAADLQEPPELIVSFFKALEADECDLAIGRRAGRDGDPLMSRTLSKMYWAVYRRAIQRDVPAGGADVFGCNDKVRTALCNMKESNTSLVGLYFWVGFRRKFIPYERLERHDKGKSSWGFWRKIKLMLDSAYAFSSLPISLLIGLGFLGVFVSSTYSLVLLGSYFAFGNQVQGFTALMLAILFSTSLNLLSLGVVGGYVWRSFVNSQGRTRPLIMAHEWFGKTESQVARVVEQGLAP